MIAWKLNGQVIFGVKGDRMGSSLDDREIEASTGAPVGLPWSLRIPRLRTADHAGRYDGAHLALLPSVAR